MSFLSAMSMLTISRSVFSSPCTCSKANENKLVQFLGKNIHTRFMFSVNYHLLSFADQLTNIYIFNTMYSWGWLKLTHSTEQGSNH